MWFCQMERKNNKEHMSKSEGPRRQERPVVRWKDKVKEYMHKRIADRGGGIE